MSSCKVYNADSICGSKQYKNYIFGACLTICIMVTVIMAYVSYEKKISNYSAIKKNDVVRYDDMIYKIVPNDLVEENSEFKEILDTYNMDYTAKKDNLGKYLLSLSKENDLYTVKGLNTKDVLILYDNNRECTYAFSEKIVPNN